MARRTWRGRLRDHLIVWKRGTFDAIFETTSSLSALAEIPLGII